MRKFQIAESPSGWNSSSRLGSSDDALLMGTSFPETPSALNRSAASSASFASATAASSSKAVLAALRALQDKIRRLEAERTQALDEASELRSKLRSYEIESEHSRQRDSLQSQRQLLEVRSENERLMESKVELEDRLKRLEDRNRDSEAQLSELSSQISRLVEAKANSDAKMKDLVAKAQILENQLEAAQNREKGKFFITCQLFVV
jgi:chromosome segregation ATPase